MKCVLCALEGDEERDAVVIAASGKGGLCAEHALLIERTAPRDKPVTWTWSGYYIEPV